MRLTYFVQNYILYTKTMFSNPKSFSLPLIKIEKIAKDTYSFFFDTINHPINFLPGQYIRLILPAVKQYNSRFFTIASSPLQKDSIMITLKRGSSEFNNALFTIKPDTNVEFFGPNGGMYLEETDHTSRVFLAGGIGIVSFYSMILYLVEKKLPIDIILIASFSKQEDMIFYQQLSQIAQRHKNIQIIYTLTQEHSVTWRGETGRISKELLKKYVSDKTKSAYYIVGFPDMVSDTEELLEEMGIRLDTIKIESFTGY